MRADSKSKKKQNEKTDMGICVLPASMYWLFL